MKAQFISDLLTPISATEAISAMRAALRTVTGIEPTKATVATLCAQWALETGRGKSDHAAPNRRLDLNVGVGLPFQAIEGQFVHDAGWDRPAAQ